MREFAAGISVGFVIGIGFVVLMMTIDVSKNVRSRNPVHETINRSAYPTLNVTKSVGVSSVTN